MSLETLTQQILPVIEEHMQQVISQAGGPGLDEFRHILAYHMGWEGPGAGPEARGKRIRPLLVALVAEACGGRWQESLPAAAAVELIHNFSLLHDDIEDNSPLRRGRQTAWVRWGIPLAINAGDAMFTLAHLSILELDDPVVARQAAQVLQRTCLHLTQGQHLDISFEKRDELSQDDYWPMIAGKTGALLAACGELGGLTGKANLSIQLEYRRFGESLGLAFQVHDDLLGIWGDSNTTGKSAESDLVAGKKSLPVLYGLGKAGAFASRWSQGPIDIREVPALARQLEEEGAKAYTQQMAQLHTDRALQALDRANPQGEAGDALRRLAAILLERQM
jgi:geranylgeranyl diphosphate synthase, type I